MTNKAITIIIPVYNVEQYLRRCVDSVLSQTYKNLEIVLVDDGSPDGCPEICDEYAKKDSRIKVIHKKNGGLSSARNAGLALPPTGDYIAFVDSDDWIEPDTYQYCMELIDQFGAEFVQYEINITDSPEKIVKGSKEKIEIYTDKEVMQYFMHRSTIESGGYSVCLGLFAKKLLDGLSFREGKINEDIDFKCKAMQRCQRLVVSNQKKYNYFQGNESLSTGGLRKKDFQLREAADLLAELTSKEEYGTIAFLGRVKQARTAFSLLSKIAYFGVADPSIDEKATIKELTKEHRKNVGTLLKAPLPISRQILAVLFAVNFNITKAVIQLAKHL